nr:hypothetical protein [Tanacetum cinerariifolium]
MATSVISISLDSSEDSMGTPTGRVILFSTIPTTIPDTTPVIAPPTTETPIVAPTIPSSPDYSSASEAESDPSEDSASGHIPPLPAISPFLSSDDETIDSDTLDTPPSLPMTHLLLRLLLLLRDHMSYLILHRDTHRQIILLLIYRVLPQGHLARDGYWLFGRLEVDPRETRVERVTHPAMQEDIPEPAHEGAAEVTYETLGDLVQRFHDHTQAISVHRIQTTEGVQREQGHRIVGVESAVTTLTERVAELERDYQRLRGTGSIESQRVDRLHRSMSRMQREMRQMRRFRFYDRVRVGRLEAKMPNTRSRASMTHEEVEELIARRVAKEMEAREVARNLETLNENKEEQEGENGGNENGGNGGNGNGDNEGNCTTKNALQFSKLHS